MVYDKEISIKFLYGVVWISFKSFIRSLIILPPTDFFTPNMQLVKKR